MQLQRERLQLCRDLLQRFERLINAHHHNRHAGARAKGARRFGLDVTRRRRMAHDDSQRIGARARGDLRIGERGRAADFDEHGKTIKAEA